MPKSGENFHRLVESIERIVSGRDGITIESPKYLPDKITGQNREHDIVLTYHESHREIIVALECRDRSRKVGISQVEEFAQKCRDTGVDKGIIVSSKGFCSTALIKAKHYSIDCLMLGEVEKIDWCSATTCTIHKRLISNTDVRAITRSQTSRVLRLFQKLENGEVREITEENSQGFARSVFGQVTPNEIPDIEGTVQIRISNLEDFYCQGDDQNQYPLADLLVSVTYRVEIDFAPIRFYQYKKGEGQELCSAAVTDVAFTEEVAGRFMFAQDGGKLSIHFRPNSKLD